MNLDFLKKKFGPRQPIGHRSPNSARPNSLLINATYSPFGISAVAGLSSGKNITAKRVSKIGEIPVYGANGLRGYTEEPNFEGEYCVIGRQGALCGNVKYFKGKAYMSDCTRSVNTARAVLTDLGI